MVLISGESGVGKTRLMEELEVKVELDGSRVVWGQCLEREGRAYQPWREVLQVLMRYVEGVYGFDVERLGPVLAAIMPELWERPTMAGLAPPFDLAPSGAQQRLNDAIVQVLRVAAQSRPMVVIIEDAHWADDATQVLINYLARVLDFGSMMVCVTFRSDELEEDQLLHKLRGGPVKRIPIQSLSPERTDELVESMLGLPRLPDSMRGQVHRITSGNTFFVQELIRILAEEGTVLQRTLDGWRVDEQALAEVGLPESIQQVIHRRLEMLSPETQHVLQFAAVVGVVFWDGALEQVGTISRAKLIFALSEGLEQELIVLRDETSFAGEREYLFVKPVMQQVSYARFPPEEKQAAHTGVASWLLAQSDEEKVQHMGLIADHLRRAGQIEQAVDRFRRAGEQAAAQFANAEAIGYFSRALDLIPEDDHTMRYALLLAREKVYDRQGVREAQYQDLVALEQLAEALADPSTRSSIAVQSARQSEVALRQAYFADVTGDYLAAIAAARAAIGAAQAAQNLHLEAVGYWQWGRALWWQADYNAARPQFEKALALAQGASLHQVEADSLSELGKISWAQGDFEGAKTCYDQALCIYREMGDLQGESFTINKLGAAACDSMHFTTARACYEQSLHICREIGDRWGEGTAVTNLGELSWRIGDFDGARIYLEQALSLEAEIGDREGECGTLGNLGHLCHNQGDDEAAREYCQQSVLIAREIGVRRWEGHALTTLGHALVGLGRLAEAAVAYRQALTLRRELGQPHLAMESLAGLASVYRAQEDLDQAHSTIEEILNYLDTDSLDGTDEPFQVYLTCYLVLRDNQDSRAPGILQTAHHLLQEQAAKISDAEMRISFLENVAENREIVNEYTSLKNRK
jgi:tetratricopeptide (TPR) repeat protein